MVGSVARKAVSPATTTTGGVTITTFEETDLAAIEEEAQIPSDHALHRFLQFSSYASWVKCRAGRRTCSRW